MDALRDEPKPKLAEDVEDQATYDKWNADVEAWGERASEARAVLCRWTVTMGVELPFRCPAPPPDS